MALSLLLLYMLWLFNNSLHLGYYPHHFRDSITISLRKPPFILNKHMHLQARTLYCGRLYWRNCNPRPRKLNSQNPQNPLQDTSSDKNVGRNSCFSFWHCKVSTHPLPPLPIYWTQSPNEVGWPLCTCHPISKISRDIFRFLPYLETPAIGWREKGPPELPSLNPPHLHTLTSAYKTATRDRARAQWAQDWKDGKHGQTYAQTFCFCLR